MKRNFAALMCAAAVATSALLAACTPMGMDASKTVVMFDGKSIANWSQVGNANWRVADGMIQADKGNGFLVTKESYGNFYMTAEFWSDVETNSGIFIRLSNPSTITAVNSYEVNIFDKRPGQEYSTGAIVDVAKVNAPIPKVGGQWSVYEITAKGSQLTVVLNGVKTVEVQDSKHARGPFSLQYAPGVVKDKGIIKFRKVQIKAI